MSSWGSGTGKTPACEYHLAQFVGLGPFFRPAGVDKISLHKTERLVDALGKRLEAQRQQEIKDLFEHDELVSTHARRALLPGSATPTRAP